MFMGMTMSSFHLDKDYKYGLNLKKKTSFALPLTNLKVNTVCAGGFLITA